MSFHTPRGAEAERLEQDARREQNWKRWGPYLSERQWGTVREDYSADGNCWGYFPHDHARSRAYRWGEDGLLGITDRECRLCFGLALWNGHDPILKERLYGLTGPEGNHGEDVKECYYYLDATPTHSYLKALYKYPQARFPYEQLLSESRRRDKRSPEFELADAGVFNDNRYFDVFAEYAKAGPNDMLIRLRVANRGPAAAALHVLPTIWFRNTWVWGCLHEGCWVKPAILLNDEDGVTAEHVSLGRYRFAADKSRHARTWLFTDNETNQEKLFGVPNYKPWVKDSFHDYVVGGDRAVVNPRLIGTKVAAYYQLELAAGEETTIDLRLCDEQERPTSYFGASFEQTLSDRVAEAEEYYDQLISPQQTAEERRVSRQGYAGLLWTKQFYHYIVEDWLKGDPDTPTPPPERKRGRNSDWPHLYNRDIISMPDKWEYPWYAAWDSAFHMLPFAKLDPHFAKDQLKLFLREWYMHPNGQIAAYEFNFSDVNPPVHAWACWRAYKLTGERGHRDVQFLSSVFQKLLINFTWWVNRKDRDGKHLFSGGFLGLDNIGVFDRSRPLPTGGHLEQADGTAWMAFYCGTMLSMALELARFDPGAEDIASKFFEHFIHIADAMNCLGGTGLWNEEDGFYYDQLHADGQTIPLRVRSIVGLIPLFAVEVLQDDVIDRLPGFRKRLDWFLEYRSDLARHISYLDADGDVLEHGHHLLAIPSRERLVRVLGYMLDENEFLSPFGIRSLSRHHEKNPYVFRTCGEEFRVDYVPAESNTYMFGGNSNWRGPIWFPLNYLLIEALERYHHFYGDSLLVECPTGSGKTMNLLQVAQELDGRLATLFLPDGNGKRPCHGDEGRYATDPHFRDLVLFHEYFHADNGRGVGASHQTGWTSLVVRCLEKQANQRTAKK